MAGRLINDHSFWAGSKSRGSVFPEGAKVKEESSAEGAGAVDRYEDTTQAIKGCQEMGDKKVKSHMPKSGYRH